MDRHRTPLLAPRRGRAQDRSQARACARHARCASGRRRRRDLRLRLLDADKENYPAYYERIYVLLRTGGLLAIDNTLWSGRLLDPREQDPETEGIRCLNEQLHRDARIDLSLLPLADGLTLAVKR